MPFLSRGPGFPSQGYSGREIRLKLGPERGSVVLQVAFELSARVGSIVSAKLSPGSPIEPNVVKTAGPKDAGNVMGSHVVLDRRRKSRLNLQGDLIENTWISHTLSGGLWVGSNPGS